MFANMASFSVEVIEAENPLEVLDYEFVPDTGGAGKFRGGMSQRKTWRMLADEGILQVRADRQTHRPYGLQGGGPGAPGRNVLDPGLPTEADAARQAHDDAAARPGVPPRTAGRRRLGRSAGRAIWRWWRRICATGWSRSRARRATTAWSRAAIRR